MMIPCYILLLLLLKLAGTWAAQKGECDVAWTPMTKGTEQPESRKGNLLAVQERKDARRDGHALGKQIPNLKWKEEAQTIEPRPPEDLVGEQPPKKDPRVKEGPPWQQGPCPSNGGPQQWCGSWMVKTSLICALGLLALVGNGTIITVIASSVSGWSHSTRLVLLSLAAADTALAVLVVPLNLYRSLVVGPVAEEGEASSCRAVAFINCCIFGASLYSLAGVSLERYVAIFYPLHYRRLLSHKRVVLLITAAWLLPALLLVPLAVPGPGAMLQVRFSASALLCEPDYGSNTTYSLFIAGTIFCPAAGTITFANLCLWLAARSQCRRGKGGRALPGKEAGLKMRCVLQLDAAARILLPVVIAFYVCWVPCIVTMLYNAVTHERVHGWIEMVALWLPIGSGFLNCFVYFWTNRSFRHKFQKIGHKLCWPCYQATEDQWWQQQQQELPTVSAAVSSITSR
nr:D(4) dopamine receptor-like [Zootoca vivipara]